MVDVHRIKVGDTIGQEGNRLTIKRKLGHSSRAEIYLVKSYSTGLSVIKLAREEDKEAVELLNYEYEIATDERFLSMRTHKM